MGYQEWRTPRDFFNRLDAEFHFTVDVAATHENALCEKHYTKEQNGLRQDWSNEVVWCNPPYQNVLPWVHRAVWYAQQFPGPRLGGATSVLLLNPCTDATWFHDYLWDEHQQKCYPNVELRFYQGRLKFRDEYGLPGPSPRHPNMIVIFHAVA